MHGMVSYFLRRLLLVPVTFVCITFMVYVVLRYAPGGPIEQAKLQRLAAGAEGGGGGARPDPTPLAVICHGLPEGIYELVSRAMAPAVAFWSPVIMTTRTPACWQR